MLLMKFSKSLFVRSKDVFLTKQRPDFCNKMATTWSVDELFNDHNNHDGDNNNKESFKSNSKLNTKPIRAQYSDKPSRKTITIGKRSMKRNTQIEFFATCISGMEKTLLEEIKALTDVDASSIRIGKSGVHYSGSMVTYCTYIFLLIL